jgi:hypothetical protein
VQRAVALGAGVVWVLPGTYGPDSCGVEALVTTDLWIRGGGASNTLIDCNYRGRALKVCPANVLHWLDTATHTHARTSHTRRHTRAPTYTRTHARSPLPILHLRIALWLTLSLPLAPPPRGHLRPL